MADDLQQLKFVAAADVYKGGALAGHLMRTGHGGVSFSYTRDYLTAGRPAVASSLPSSEVDVETPAGALPPFFAGLLPEGHRLTVLRDAAKTSFDDELTLLLAVGADAPGDVQVVPADEDPVEPATLADTSKPEDLDFSALANAVDSHALPGVQDKSSASMLAGTCKAPLIATRDLYLQFVFAWLTGNGDLHAKNLSILGRQHGGFVMAPVYDVPCTLVYEDETLALPVSGKTKNLKSRHWAAFAAAIGLPERAAAAANALALSAAGAINLEALPFTGSPSAEPYGSCASDVES